MSLLFSAILIVLKGKGAVEGPRVIRLLQSAAGPEFCGRGNLEAQPLSPHIDLAQMPLPRLI